MKSKNPLRIINPLRNGFNEVCNSEEVIVSLANTAYPSDSFQILN